jgi:uncharacterized membrane protein YphA (DoxX/SURF4 family)
MENTESFFILVFLAITFVQSGYDKFTDWGANVGWLKEHFAGTFLANKAAFSLRIIMVLEIIAGVLCSVGIIELSISGGTTFGQYGAAVSCVTLLLLLYGQRIAKDYEGARTIVIYFIPAVMGVYFLR